jgi:uroporphyrin-III C-methyltransferase/precorrin-2 dehydrogenase/sirohydrochlorin ferrochelatase
MALSLLPSDPPARIAPLARLPVFLKLEGRRAIVAGATAAAAWKTELLAAAGARVHVYAPEPSSELLAVVAGAGGVVILHARPWTTADLADAAIAVGACEDDSEAARFAGAARAAGVPVNVIDRPDYCDFAFGAIVNRSPLVIGVSTDGAAPIFAQAIRARLETLIPQGFARWAEAAAHWRPRVQALRRAVAVRFWENFTARAVARAHDYPDECDLQALLGEASGGRAAATATVILAPDDAELLTLRAVRALQSADVILFDAKVPAAILDFARREARRMMIGAQGDAESAATMITLAKAGRRIVRLIGKSVARAEAETAACRAAGVTVEVVARVTPPAQGEGGNSGDQVSGIRDQSSARI